MDPWPVCLSVVRPSVRPSVRQSVGWLVTLFTVRYTCEFIRAPSGGYGQVVVIVVVVVVVGGGGGGDGGMLHDGGAAAVVRATHLPLLPDLCHYSAVALTPPHH